jgi:hypothetical protein
MIIDTRSPVYNTLLVFTIIMILLHIKKPDIIYDKKKKEYRQFGTSNGKTLLPIYVVGILIAIIIYIFFNNISQECIPKEDTIKENYNTSNQIHQIQSQIQQILQQQILQQQINNNQQLIKNNIKIPNNFNIYD